MDLLLCLIFVFNPNKFLFECGAHTVLQQSSPPSHSVSWSVTPFISSARLPATHLPWLDPPLRKAGSSPVSFTAQSPGHRTVSHTQQALNKYSLNEEAVREWPQLSRLNNPVFLLIWNSTFDSLLYFFCRYWSI